MALTLPMRTPDARDPDFYLLEEMAQPRASLNTGRITVWVYRDQGIIREIVLSGHAESRTCASATTALIEAAKQLQGDVEWMLTCGAAYFRVSPSILDGPVSNWAGPSLGWSRETQLVLSQMLEAVGELEKEKGLVEVFNRPWQALASFRELFNGSVAATPPEILLPDKESAVGIADYFPIVPKASGVPFKFVLEGWDFDSPKFQLVADHHLRKVQRELLRDALRRRRAYRGWLRDWTRSLVVGVEGPGHRPFLGCLPKSQADAVRFSIPGTIDEPEAEDVSVDVLTFLSQSLQSFLDRGQRWHRDLANTYGRMRFDQAPAEFLDQPRRPGKITEVDYERGVTHEREATPDDPSFTWRDRLREHDAQYISRCLAYIRRMDRIIKPYEQLRLKRGAAGDASDTGGDRGIMIVDEISRRIVVETMIRGWPSFYLDDKDDQDVFDNWAQEYRQHIWTIMDREAQKAGLAPEILREDNVAYDIRFNEDLGCTVQPLMLVDDAVHVLLHGTGAGASVALPLWPRHQSSSVPADILDSGADNRARAAALIDRASAQASEPAADVQRASQSIRWALACHPAEAGKAILNEWANRLGRDTKKEFESARHIIMAAELWSRRRFAESGEHARAYLAAEADPVRDAFVLAALAEITVDGNAHIELRETYLRMQKFIERHDELVPRVKETVEHLQAGFGVHPNKRQREELEQIQHLKKEIDDLSEKCHGLQGEIESAAAKRKQLIEEALRNGSSSGHAALTRAAARSPEELKRVLESDGLYARWSEDMSRRYADLDKIVEVRGLLDLVYELTVIDHFIGLDPRAARVNMLEKMRHLSRAPWLPDSVETDLRYLVEEFGKGNWDRLQTYHIRAVLREATGTCLTRMNDLLSDSLLSLSYAAEVLTTRIHVAQIVEAKYRTALEILLSSGIPLGRAIAVPWTVLDRAIVDFPEQARLVFSRAERAIVLENGSQRTPLLKAERISPTEEDHLEVVFGRDRRHHLSPLAACVSEGLLALEVEPSKSWQLWRDAMLAIQPELICVLSRFGYEANLMPDHAPPLTEEGKESVKRLDHLAPRDEPAVDWAWHNPDRWELLIGPEVRRHRYRHAQYVSY